MLRLSLFLSLLAFWLLLSGDIFHGFKHPYLFWAGVVCCALVTLISGRKGIIDREGHPVVMLVKSVLYVPWLLWQILLSNFDVARRVWMPNRPIAPRMVTIPHKLRSDLGIVVYANSITLTPGTVTVDVGDGSLLVHALTEAAIQGLESGAMHDRVAKLEVKP